MNPAVGIGSVLSDVAAALPASFSARDFEQFTPKSLKRRPITICVFGFAVTAILSNLVHGSLGETKDTAIECSKFFWYYLIMVSALNSTQRLRQFMMWLTFQTVVIIYSWGCCNTKISSTCRRSLMRNAGLQRSGHGFYDRSDETLQRQSLRTIQTTWGVFIDRGHRGCAFTT